MEIKCPEDHPAGVRDRAITSLNSPSPAFPAIAWRTDD
jgi:hypothetical protein